MIDNLSPLAFAGGLLVREIENERNANYEHQLLQRHFAPGARAG